MRLAGNVEIRDYTNNEMIQHQHSVVSLYSKQGQDILLLQNPYAKGGIRYKISGNILQILVGIICKGKLSIHLKEPTHELGIYNHTVLLQSFANLLRCLCNAAGPSQLVKQFEARCTLNDIATVAFLKSVHDYAKLSTLSHQLRVLKLHHIEMDCVPEAVTALQQLTHLEVINGSLCEVPACVGNMPYLTVINLPHNRLGVSNKWEFLSTPLMRQNLRQLDLQSNEIEYLPDVLIKLDRLFALHLDQNLLQGIPTSIHEMRQLRALTVSHNRMRIFPYNLFPLATFSLDLTNNPFISHYFLLSSSPTGPYLPSLKELAGRAVIDFRVPVSVEKTPKSIFNYLDRAKGCEICAGAYFDTYFPCRYIPFSRIYAEISRGKEDLYTQSDIRNVCSRRCMQPELKSCEVLGDLTPEQFQGMVRYLC